MAKYKSSYDKCIATHLGVGNRTPENFPVIIQLFGVIQATQLDRQRHFSMGIMLPKIASAIQNGKWIDGMRIPQLPEFHSL